MFSCLDAATDPAARDRWSARTSSGENAIQFSLQELELALGIRVERRRGLGDGLRTVRSGFDDAKGGTREDVVSAPHGRDPMEEEKLDGTHRPAGFLTRQGQQGTQRVLVTPAFFQLPNSLTTSSSQEPTPVQF